MTLGSMNVEEILFLSNAMWALLELHQSVLDDFPTDCTEYYYALNEIIKLRKFVKDHNIPMPYETGYRLNIE